MTTQPVSCAPLRRAAIQLVLAGRVDERLDADVVALAAPARAARRASPRGSTSGSPAASTSFVLSFAACTSGWSNGLIPSTWPATAVANSQRKNSRPSSYGSARRDLAALPVRPVGRLARRGHEPLALLAGRLGEQLLGPEPEAASATRRCRPCRGPACQPSPSWRPSSSPGLPSLAAGRPPSSRVARSRKRLERRRPSAPPARSRTATAPSSGRRSSARPGRRRGSRARCASRSSSEPGSVIAANCAPRPPVRSQK